MESISINFEGEKMMEIIINILNSLFITILLISLIFTINQFIAGIYRNDKNIMRNNMIIIILCILGFICSLIFYIKYQLNN